MLAGSVHFLFNYRVENLCLTLTGLKIDVKNSSNHASTGPANPINMDSVRMLSNRVWRLRKGIGGIGGISRPAAARKVAPAPRDAEEEKYDNVGLH